MTKSKKSKCVLKERGGYGVLEAMGAPSPSTGQTTRSVSVRTVLQRNLIFISGKGGVGKTAVSRAIARCLAARGGKTLWTTFEDPTQPLGHLEEVAPKLWYLNCEASQAFEEYANLKLGHGRIAHLFVQSKLMQYLAKAAPGIHELVLLGKIWHERQNYSHVVVDMPSTGYGLAMFQSAKNFSAAFRGGPIHRDAEAMLATFRDPSVCGHLIVALPEEMPLRESLELDEYLKTLFPENPAAFLANRLFPSVCWRDSKRKEELDRLTDADLKTWGTPLASSVLDYALNRTVLEQHNLRLWREPGIEFGELPFLPPDTARPQASIIEGIARELQERRLI